MRKRKRLAGDTGSSIPVTAPANSGVDARYTLDFHSRHGHLAWARRNHTYREPNGARAWPVKSPTEKRILSEQMPDAWRYEEQRKFLMEFSEEKIRSVLARSWSSQTAIQWKPDNPALGQCNATAILIKDMFGGQILKTRYQEGTHFYNEIDGRRYDFTDSQFSSQIEYDDLESSSDEAARSVTETEMEILRNAFQTFYK